MMAVNPSLDLGTVTISPLREEHDLSSFSCGDSDLDKFIQNRARKFCENNRMKIFCAHPRDGHAVYGLYSLAIRYEDTKKLLAETDPPVPEKNFPALYLGTLAVALPYQNKRLGTILLMNALRRAYYISQNVAVFGVALRSQNERTTRLYEKYGFGLRETTHQPLMVLPVWSLNDLIEKTETG
jgi:ribosomal protein S18 acetylase RimI-like enzyme